MAAARAWDRMVRAIALSIGAAGILFLLISDPVVTEQLPWAVPWWNVLALACLAGPLAVLLLGALWLPPRWLRAAALVLVLGQLVVLALVPLGWQRGALSLGEGWPWALGIGAVAVCAVPLACGGRVLAPYLVLFAALHSVALWWALDDLSTAALVSSAVQSPTLGLVFAAVVLVALRSGRQLDVETGLLRAEAGRRAWARALAVERSRVDALVRDAVVSALWAGGWGADGQTVRRGARLGLTVLAELADPAYARSHLAAAEVVARLRQLCVELDEDLVFSAQVAEPDEQVSVDAARLLQEVVGEAVRNSVAHAGGSGTVARSVAVRVGGGRVSASVSDDGVGFDPARVPPQRTGIEVGMRARAAQVEGAELVIRSAPGRGTEVQVSAPVYVRVPDPGQPRPERTAPVGRPVEPTTAAQVVGLHTRGAAVLAALYLALQVVRLFELHLPLWATALNVVVLVVLAVGAAMLLAGGADMMRLPQAVVLSLIPLLVALCGIAVMSTDGQVSPAVLWWGEPTAMLMAFLPLRGRFGLAWAGQGVMLGAVQVWLLLTGARFPVDFAQFALSLVMLVAVCSLFAALIRRQVRAINSTRVALIAVTTEWAEAEARLHERDEQLAYLRAVAEPLLVRMERDGALDERTRAHARLMECRLRDRIRARALASEPVLDAAQAARSRGVEVTMLDDGALSGAPEQRVEEVREVVRRQLEGVGGESVTVRVLPPGRPELCTVVVTGEQRTEVVRISAGVGGELLDVAVEPL